MEKIRNHKYVSGRLSIVDRIVSQLCDKIITFMPTNIAPNLITLIGVLIQFHTVILFYYYDKFVGEIPSFVWFYCSVCILVY